MQEALNSCQNYLKERKGQAEGKGNAGNLQPCSSKAFAAGSVHPCQPCKEKSSLLVLSSCCGEGEKTLGSHAGSESPLGSWEKMNSVLFYSILFCCTLSCVQHADPTQAGASDTGRHRVTRRCRRGPAGSASTVVQAAPWQLHPRESSETLLPAFVPLPRELIRFHPEITSFCKQCWPL